MSSLLHKIILNYRAFVLTTVRYKHTLYCNDYRAQYEMVLCENDQKLVLFNSYFKEAARGVT